MNEHYPRQPIPKPQLEKEGKSDVQESIDFLRDIFNNQLAQRPQPTEQVFVDLYGQKEIDAAIIRLNARMANLENKNKKSFLEGDMSEEGFTIGIERSELFEALIADELNKGLLPGVNAYMASVYDDKINKTDIIVQDKLNKKLYFGIDCMISNTASHAYEKMHDIYHNDIRENRYGQAKFFKDKKGFAGKVVFPRFVVVGTKKDFIDYARMRRVKPANDESLFIKLPFQYDVLRQIDAQVDIYNYAIEDGYITNERFTKTIRDVTDWIDEIKTKTHYKEVTQYLHIQERLLQSAAIKGIESFRDNN